MTSAVVDTLTLGQENTLNKDNAIFSSAAPKGLSIKKAPLSNRSSKSSALPLARPDARHFLVERPVAKSSLESVPVLPQSSLPLPPTPLLRAPTSPSSKVEKKIYAREALLKLRPTTGSESNTIVAVILDVLKSYPLLDPQQKRRKPKHSKTQPRQPAPAAEQVQPVKEAAQGSVIIPVVVEEIHAEAELEFRPVQPVVHATVEEKPVVVQVEKEQEEAADDGKRAEARRKQITFGMSTEGWKKFIELVPEGDRKRIDPIPPDVEQKCSKRSFDGQVRLWRQRLHLFDTAKTQQDVVEIRCKINDDVHRRQIANYDLMTNPTHPL